MTKWRTEEARLAYNVRQKRQRRQRELNGGKDYHAMFEAQNGLCAICKNPETPGRQMHIDHDHESGKIRSLLCGKCNMGLGLFKDDPRRLQSAIEYILKHQESSDSDRFLAR